MSGISTYKIANIHGTTSITDVFDETKKLNFDLSNITTSTTRNIIIPDSDVTIVDLSLGQTLTNKTFDADDNIIINIDNNNIKTFAGIDARKIADGSVSNTNFQHINSLSSLAVGISDTQTLTNKTFTDSLTLFQDNADNTKKVQFEISEITPGTTRVITFPDANTTLIGNNTSQTLVNKTLDADNNTIINISNSEIKLGAGIDASKVADGSVSNTEFLRINSLQSQAVGVSDSQILTNKNFIDSNTFFQNNSDSTKKLQFSLSNISQGSVRTLTVPNFNTTIVGTGATQTLTNKTVNAESNTILNIKNENIKFGAGIDASKLADGTVSNAKFQYINSLTSNVQTQINNHISSTTTHGVIGEIVGTSDNQTLLNKTFSVSTTYFQDNVDNTKRLKLELSNISSETTRILTVPDANATVVGTDVSQTLRNKTISADSNIVRDIDNDNLKPNARIDASKIANGSVSNTEFQYINSLTSNVQTQINNHLLDTTVHGVSGNIVGTTDSQTLENKTFVDSSTLFQDNSDNTKKLKFQLSNISSLTTRTLIAPDTDDTIVVLNTNQTLTNKLIDANNNTITNLKNSNIGLDANIDASKIANGSVSNTEFQYINSLTSNVQTQIDNHLFNKTVHGITGVVVGTSDTQTLTNKTFGNNLNMSGNRIINLGTPINDDDSVNKAYVDSVVSGLDIKGSVVVATVLDLNSNESILEPIIYDENGGINSRGQIVASLVNADIFIVDGVTIGPSDNGTRILLKNQISADQNGIWTTTISDSGTSLILNRATDFDADNKVTSGAFCFVEQGVVNQNRGYTLTNDNPIIVGGSSGTHLIFTQFSGAGSINAGNGLTKTGDTLNVVGSNTIIANSNSLEINSSNTTNQVLLSSGSVGSSATFGKLPLNDTNAITGVLSVSYGGIGATNLASGYFLQGNGTNPVLAIKAVPSGGVVGTTDTQVISNKTFTDNTTYFQDNIDNSKKLQFQLSDISTFTTRILSIPDDDTTIVGTDTNQTLTNKTIDAYLNTIINIDNSNIRLGANIDATKIADGSVTDAKFKYLNSVTSDIQEQLDSMVTLETGQTVIGEKTIISHMSIGPNSNPQSDDILRIEEELNSGGILDGIDIRIVADAENLGQYNVNGLGGYSVVKGINFTSGSKVNGLVYGVYGSGTTAGHLDNLNVMGLSTGVYKRDGATFNVNDATGARVFLGKSFLGTNGFINATNGYVMKLEDGDDGLNVTNHYGLYIEEPTRGTSNYTVYTEGGNHRFGGTFHTTGDITTDGTVNGRNITDDGNMLDNHVSSNSAHGVDGSIVGTTDSQTLSNKNFIDSTTFFVDESDNTKKFRFELLKISTATTRILTVPNSNTTIVGTNISQTLTNKTLDSPTIQNNLIMSNSYIEISEISPPSSPGNGKGRIYKKIGSDGLFYNSNTSGEVDLTTQGITYSAILRDQKTSGTNGGTFASGSWQTRTFTNIEGSAYLTGDVTLSSNQITLREGIYHISAKSVAYRVNSNVLRFRNVTDSTTDIEGVSSYANSSFIGRNQSVAILEGVLKLTSQKTFELQHYCTSTRLNDGFGFAHGISGVNEIYSLATITKQ